MKTRFLFLSAALTILFLTVSTVYAISATVQIYPETLPLGSDIYIDIEPDTDIYGLLVVAGPFSESMSPILEHFHMDYLLTGILEGGIINAFTYPHTSWMTYRSPDPYEGPNTNHVGVYIVGVLLADINPSVDLNIAKEILYTCFYNGEWPGTVSGYVYGHWIQVTIASVFVIPDILGTMAGVAIPCLALGSLKIRKHIKKESKQ